MLIDNFIEYLETLFPDIDFYNGSIDRNLQQCVGVYLAQGGSSQIALGGLDNTSFNSKTISLLIHWTENANSCEVLATSIYNTLQGKSNIYIGGKRIAAINMLDAGPININRDSNNICEMVIRISIIYDREVI